jgi:hypothetical protein
MGSSVGSAADARAEVLRRLRARRAELVRAIFTRVRGGALGPAGAQDAEYAAGLRTAVAAAVDYGLEGIERGAEWPGPIPVATLEQARRAARVGVSLDTVLRRYVAGHTLLEEFVLEEADRPEIAGGRDALRGALRAQALALDRLIEAITGAYGDELRRAGRSPEQRHAERVRRLLDGGLAERSGLDYELGVWHLGAIAVGVGAGEAVRRLAQGVDRRLLSVPQDERSVWVWLGGRERFAMGDVERIASVVAPEGTVLAFGEPARGFEGWRLTHRQAQAALVIALRRPRTFTRYADVALLATALKDELVTDALIEIYLSPLDEQRDGGVVLRRTLRAYFAAGRNASSAAAKLNVTRHTVENRLRTVEQSLGRSPNAYLAELEIALGLEELTGAGGGEDRSLPGDRLTGALTGTRT